MLQKIFKLILIAALGFGAVSANAQSLEDEHILPTSGDSWTPWPWSSSIPFPWSDIEGSWRVKEGDFISYLSLRVLAHKYNELPQLAIRQYDGETCRLLSRGVGFERNKKMYAQMTSLSGLIYRVHITAFDKANSPQPPLPGDFATGDVMVVSMGQLDQTSQQMSHMQIVKVSHLMTQKGCKQDLVGQR